MADWQPQPLWGYEVGRRGPLALVTELTDGSSIRRRKRDVVLRRFRAGFRRDDDTIRWVLQFYEFYGTDRVFTFPSYDLADGPGTGSGEETWVRFAEPPTYTRAMFDNNAFEVEFIEELPPAVAS